MMIERKSESASGPLPAACCLFPSVVIDYVFKNARLGNTGTGI
jgi:hypothetical protein